MKKCPGRCIAVHFADIGRMVLIELLNDCPFSFPNVRKKARGALQVIQLFNLDLLIDGASINQLPFLQQLNFCLAHPSLDTLLICPDITDLSRLKSSVKDSFGDTPRTLRKKAASGGKIGKIAD